MCNSEENIINAIKGKIDKSHKETKYRMCGKAVEKITHIVSECTRLAQKEYTRRHDWIGSCIIWEICGAKGIPVATKWQEHQPEGVMQNETCKVIWDFTIQADYVLTTKEPDLIVDNERNEFQITDFAVPYDTKKYLKRTEESVEYESESSSRSNWSSENTFSSTREKNADLALRQGLLSYENNFLLYTGRTLRKILEM